MLTQWEIYSLFISFAFPPPFFPVIRLLPFYCNLYSEKLLRGMRFMCPLCEDPGITHIVFNVSVIPSAIKSLKLNLTATVNLKHITIVDLL